MKKQIGKYSYTIENNEVRIWDEEFIPENGAPFIHQPYDHNTNEPFKDEEDAESWAINFIEKRIYQDNNPIPVQEIYPEDIIGLEESNTDIIDQNTTEEPVE